MRVTITEHIEIKLSTKFTIRLFFDFHDISTSSTLLTSKAIEVIRGIKLINRPALVNFISHIRTLFKM